MRLFNAPSLLVAMAGSFCGLAQDPADPSVFQQAAMAHEQELHRLDGTSRWGTFDRRHGLAFQIDGVGMTVRSEGTVNRWQHRLNVTGTRDADGILRPWVPQRVSSRVDRTLWKEDLMDVEYVHGPDGLRQNFIVHHSQGPSGTIIIELALEGDLVARTQDPSTIRFDATDGSPRYFYRDLKTWDADGNPLHAFMHVKPTKSGAQALLIEVDARTARYPVTIDPVSTTPTPLLLGTQIGERFGTSVATAGDLNGDGYSDVVVGAPQAVVGGITQGAVYLYYGGPNGIGSTPDLVLSSGQQGSEFGCAVSTAGDVNGDGFSDLLIGARVWESDIVNELSEGAVFIYHGSATGITNTHDLRLESNTAGAVFGSNVATLGDIDGDGYSDIIVGAYLAAYPTFQEGAAFVYRGSPTGIIPVFRHRLERNQGGAHFGRAVASAGDVNGDGYDDVIVGAPQFVWTTGGDDQGAAFIWYGGPGALGAGPNPVPALTLYGSGVNDGAFGWSVGTAGDLNGDGYSDVAIGAWFDNIGGPAGEGVARVYMGGPTGLDPTPVVEFESNQANATMGRWVGTAGDVNGDGYGDLLIGIPRFSNPQSQEGIVRLYFGGPTGIANPPSITFDINGVGANFGECLSTAGDINGDGYSDIIIGAFLYSNTGAAAVFMGGPYSTSLSPSLLGSGGSANARKGQAVANAGDVNGDGYADALVSSPFASNGQANEGLVHLHLGGPSGLSPVPLVQFEANVANAQYGASVASAGDVNGDGYADVLIGAPTSGAGGRAYVYHGSPTGPTNTPALTLTGPAASSFGFSVFTAGDINADGYADIVIGAPDVGSAHVYHGSAAGLIATPAEILSVVQAGNRFGHAVGTAGDVNGDGYSDVIIGARDHNNGQAGEGVAFIYHGSDSGLVVPHATLLEINQAGARFGTAVAGAGDVNGDGYFDVVVGADRYDFSVTDEGGAFVFRGSPTGVVTTGYTILRRNVANAWLGTSVAEAGDVNGDGYADIIIGAPGWENNAAQTDEGACFIHRGSTAGITNAAFDQVESNIAGHQLGFAVAGGGDVDGDGYSDILAGAPLASPSLANEGEWRWHRGNQARSLGRLSRQYLADLNSPLSTNSMDFSDPQHFGIGHLARSPVHRMRGRLVWEVVYEGQPFSGNPITNSLGNTGVSAGWTDMGTNGVEIKELIYKPSGYIRYKWRVRVEYDPVKMIDGQRFGRWFYGFASGVGDIGILPIELLYVNAWADKEVNRIVWATATESNTSHFLVERSPDNAIFTAIAATDAAGESLQTVEYTTTDDAPPAGASYYRVVAIDQDGGSTTSPSVVVHRGTQSGRLSVWPDPAGPEIQLRWEVHDPSHLRLLDATGRTVLDQPPIRSGDRSATLSLEGIPPGQYMLMIRAADGTILDRTRFVKY